MNSIIKSQYDTRDYMATQLNNGIETLFISDNEADKSYVAIIVNAGFLQDGEVHGLAHFLEHMLFMGTEKYPNVGEYMQFINTHGGKTNASTISANTNYHFAIDSNYLEEASDRLSQFFIKPLFKEETVAKEINAVNEEFIEMKNNFLWMSVQLMKQAINPNHPFRNFDVGSNDTLNRPDIREKLIDYFNKYYVSRNMKLVMIDKRSCAELRHIASIFEAIPDKQVNIPIYPKPIENQTFIKFNKPVDPSNGLWIYWTVPRENSLEHTSVMRYITYLLGKDTEHSLSQILKSSNLISALNIATIYNLHNYRLVCMVLSLTGYGIAQIQSVLQIINKFILDLANDDMNKHIIAYNKCCKLQHTFEEKIELSEMLENILDNATTEGLPLPLALRYHTMPCINDINVFTKVLSGMPLKDVIVVSTSPVYQGALSNPLELYNIQYAIDKTQQDLSSKLTKFGDGVYDFNCKIIPQKLLVYTNKEDFSTPVSLIENSNFYYMYEKNQYPKACIVLEFSYPKSYASIETYIAYNILLCHINQLINYKIDDSKLLGATYSLVMNMDSLIISIYCFNDNLKYYCSEILSLLNTADMSYIEFGLAKGAFQVQLENLRQARMSIRLQNIIAKGVFDSIYTENDMIQELSKMTHHMMPKIDFKTCSQVKCLIYGNIPKTVAFDIIPTLKQINVESSQVDNWKLQPIPVGIKYVDINKVTGSPNSFLVSVDVCLGVAPRKSAEYHKLHAYNLLVDNYMHSKFFEIMRSQKQLGYTVKCIPRFYGKNVICVVMTFSILSSHYTHAQIEKEILGFFELMSNKLNELTVEKLGRYIGSAITSINEKPNNITDTALDIFEQISNESYDYNYRQTITDELKKIELNTFKQMYSDLFINPTRRIIIVRST